MRVDRFKTYLFDLLNNAERSDIASVDYYDVLDNERPLRDIRVQGTDGVVVQLRIVGSAPPGGDDQREPEKIIEKPTSGVEVTRR